MNSVATQNRSPVADFKANIKKLHEAGELDMLPSNVSFDAFRNAAVVAFTDNPALQRCTNESVFRAIRRVAAMGLVPDGNEAAIVAYGREAQALPMVRGLIKTARNSGEIISIWADVVYENEDLSVWVEEGERQFKHDYNPLQRSGGIVGAYAVAKLRDGTIEFEPMGMDQIDKRRRASANQKGPKPTGVWADWLDEMAKKTVIRALCKRLPISSEDMRRILVDAEDNKSIRDVTPDTAAPPPPEHKNLAQRMAEMEAEKEAPLDGEIVAEAQESDVGKPTSDDPPEKEPDLNSLEAGEGRVAAQGGVALNECPDWAAGWNETKHSSMKDKTDG